MAEPIIFSSLMVEIILPFVLVISIVYAVLQKSKILGEGKNQLDAFVALSVALIAVAFKPATAIIIQLMPVLAITLVSILVFLLIYGMVFKGDYGTDKSLKIILAVIAAIVVGGSLFVFTGVFDYLRDLYISEAGSGILANVLVFVVIIVAVAVVLGSSGKSGSSGGK
jgi:hypothetical protein